VWTRDVEAEVLPVCEELGIGLVPWSPLGKGYLTGTVRPATTFPREDRRSTMPRFTRAAMSANWPLVELLGRVADRQRARPAQVALAWLLAQKPWIVPIPGTTKLGHLEENAQAADLELTPADMREIEAGYATIGIQGARAADDVLSLIDDGAKAGTSSAGGRGISPLRVGREKP
jgi:aryl-alcohol dehydrogenase-like predicted oxidoreductase